MIGKMLKISPIVYIFTLYVTDAGNKLSGRPITSQLVCHSQVKIKDLSNNTTALF